MRKVQVFVLMMAAGSPLPAAAGEPLRRAERIACQRAVESVYWEHRIWPETNPTAKPGLDAVLPQAALERRAEDAVAMSRALEELWSEPLTPAVLQREVERMASSTRRPAMLAALFAALGNDPVRVAECLARPQLAARRLRTRYEQDQRIHGALEQRARRELARVGTARNLRRAGDRYSETEWVLDAAATPSAGVVALDAAAWAGLMDRLASESGGRARAAGVVSPLIDDGERFRAFGILSLAPGRVRVAVSEWRKEPFAAWWERTRASFADGAALAAAEPFALPDALARQQCADDTWSSLPYRPPALAGHQAVWTGAEMVAWGGVYLFTVGGRYDPALDTWHPMAVDGEPAWRSSHVAVWTGTQMVVWGGWGFLSSDNVLGSGGRYDPVTDSWTPTSMAGAPAARMGHSGVWTGSRLVVWGGCTGFGCGTRLASGGLYDPAADTWTPTSMAGAATPRSGHTAVWAGTEMIVWSGCTAFGCGADASGGRYDPAADSWRPLSTTGAPSGRSLHTAVWTGTQMIVWGGVGSSGRLATGGRYTPATNSWSPTATAGAPIARRHHTATWAPNVGRMVVWGGCVDHDCSDHASSGGRYDPVADAWTPTSTVNVPWGRSRAAAVWTGTEVVIWGGCHGGECQINVNTGGRYDPAADSWTPVGLPPDPGPRLNHTALWTGAEMIVWGGHQAGYGPVLTGRRYDPATDTWAGMDFTGYVGARDGHTAVWTGAEMIVWGGREAGLGTTVTGGRYNPAADTWQTTSFDGVPARRAFHTAEWTGSRMIVWGGCEFESCTSYHNSGGAYDPAADAWTPTSLTAAPSPRVFHASVWTGSSMVIWGGFNGSNLASGARYNPALDQWTAVTSAGAPSPRRLPTGVWTGGRVVVWGGLDATAPLGSGGRYDPVANTWSPTSVSTAPAGRWRHTAVAAGPRMIVWGGCTDMGCDAFDITGMNTTGALYDPTADTWEETSTLGAAHARTNHTAVWTGEEMIVWGGWRGSSSHITNTGAAYCAGGQPAPAPDVDVAPVFVAFGPTMVGSSVDRALRVSNAGTGPLTITSVAAAGRAFSIAGDGCTGQVLAAGGECTIVARFAPAAARVAYGSVTVRSSDPDEPAVSVALDGWGWRRRAPAQPVAATMR